MKSLISGALSFFACVNAWSVVSVRVIEAENKSLVLQDRVVKESENGDSILVRFSKSKGTYLLRHSNPDFAAYNKAIVDSLNNKTIVKVTVQSEKGDIVEVK